jgi:hypothetical protein
MYNFYFTFRIEYYEEFCNTIYNTNVQEILEDLSGHLQMDPKYMNINEIINTMRRGGQKIYYIRWFPCVKKKYKYIFKLIDNKTNADFSIKRIK